MKITKTFGTATHSRVIEEDGLQVDRIRVSIPLSALSEEAQDLLGYWCVEEFNYACLDWADGELRLYYRTDHYLPEGYEPEEVEED